MKWFYFFIFLVLIVQIPISLAGKDFYKILGVKRNANQDQIKDAYKKLAFKYHPDKNKAKDAQSKFIEINNAYEILSDANKKQIYDQYGEEGLNGNVGSNSKGGSGKFHFTDPFEIFKHFFGHSNSNIFTQQHGTNSNNVLYPKGSGVIRFSSKSYKQMLKLVSDNGEIWLINYYSPACPHCQKLASPFIKIASKLKNIIRVGAVDVTKIQDVAQREKVKGVPVIKLFTYKHNNKSPLEYQGPRTASDIYKWIKTNLVVKAKNIVNKQTYDSFIRDEKFKLHLLLYTNQNQQALKFNILCGILPTVNCGFVYRNSELNQINDISSLPTLLLFKKNKAIKYTGSKKLKDMIKWLFKNK